MERPQWEMIALMLLEPLPVKVASRPNCDGIGWRYEMTLPICHYDSLCQPMIWTTPPGTRSNESRAGSPADDLRCRTLRASQVYDIQALDAQFHSGEPLSPVNNRLTSFRVDSETTATTT